MNIDRAYMKVVIAKLLDDIEAKEQENCYNGLKVQISFNRPEAKVLLDALMDEREGHWIFTDECREHGRCSKCGFGEVDLMGGPINYCPRCGAKMTDCRSTDHERGQA